MNICSVKSIQELYYSWINLSDVFTVPDSETDTGTQKMGCRELYGAVQRQTSTQIPTGFCVNLLVSVLAGCVNTPEVWNIFSTFWCHL